MISGPFHEALVLIVRTATVFDKHDAEIRWSRAWRFGAKRPSSSGDCRSRSFIAVSDRFRIEAVDLPESQEEGRRFGAFSSRSAITCDAGAPY